MESDMIIALKEASANATTIFGLNHHARPAQRYQLQRLAGQMHDLGASLKTSTLKLPQARQTFTVLGVQPSGHWGLLHGCNEHGVAAGVTHWRSRLAGEPQTLSGCDLVRLTLERSRSAHHAVDVLTDLIDRYGQCRAEDPADPSQRSEDHIFLLADRDEAYVLEACGRYWALLECRNTRVVTSTAMIHQDWRRLAPGLADYVIQRGWWQDDGSKIDFVRCLGATSAQARAAQRRWGRASLALAQQHGAIDAHFLRRMLAEHYENNLELLPAATEMSLTTSFLVSLHDPGLPVLAWVAFGPPRAAIYFPVSLVGELPVLWHGEHGEVPTLQDRTREMEQLALGKPKDRNRLTQALERLQTRLDQDAEDFLLKAHDAQRQSNPFQLEHLATDMMHRHAELFQKEYRQLLQIDEKTPPPVHEAEEVFFA